MSGPQPFEGIRGIHHVGLTVSDMDRAVAFWEAFLGVPARWRTVLDRPYLGRNVGYPGVRIEAAFFDLPGGGVVELLDYLEIARRPVDAASGNPGHAHLCLAVADIDAVASLAVAAGARPVCPDGPQSIDGGPNLGARAVYLRIPPDSASLELFQPTTP